MKITALAGGVGGSKLLVGLSGAASPDDITIVANTGDDIEVFGLRVCPDVDTITYTLAGVINEENGWGVAGDTFECLTWLGRLGEPSWFNLGDRDLAVHIYRTRKLREGETLTQVTEHLRQALGVGPRILPMTDSYVPTLVSTDEGEMHLQEYLVRRRCRPRVRSIRGDGAENSIPAPGVRESIFEADAVLICPSNPFISIGPILNVPGVRESLRETRARVVAVSPIVRGSALKGPAAAMLHDLGHEASAVGVARLYAEFVDVFVLDERDGTEDGEQAARIRELGMRAVVTNTVMRDTADKLRLARAVLAAAEREQ